MVLPPGGPGEGDRGGGTPCGGGAPSVMVGSCTMLHYTPPALLFESSRVEVERLVPSREVQAGRGRGERVGFAVR